MVQIVLAEPRGFCAGVERAIDILEAALDKYEPPIYVKHEIVHNHHVVQGFQERGVIFVEDLSCIPSNSVIIFSAHGVSKKVEEQAKQLNLITIDATCPLVQKVHKKAQKSAKNGSKMILIGHKNHPEVEGTMGRVESDMILVESAKDAEQLVIEDDCEINYMTQTTLSIDDTREIIDIIKKKFPRASGPDLLDICYATHNRQKAVKELAKVSDTIIVIGSANSSNSNRLRAIAEKSGINSYLVDDCTKINLSWFHETKVIGITAGASAPELLVQATIDFLAAHLPISAINTLKTVDESVKFKLPKI